MKSLIFAIGCFLGCAKSSSDKPAQVPLEIPEETAVNDPSPVNKVQGEWAGFDFEPESDEKQLKLHREVLVGTWIIGGNRGRTDRGIRWEGVVINYGAERGGMVSIFSSDATGNTLTACSYQTASKLTKTTFSRVLSNGGSLLDLRFEDGSFQQLLMRRIEAGVVAMPLKVQPVDVTKVSIESFLNDTGGSIGNDLMRKVSVVCE